LDIPPEITSISGKEGGGDLDKPEVIKTSGDIYKGKYYLGKILT
jgi:hypothetical protein